METSLETDLKTKMRKSLNSRWRLQPLSFIVYGFLFICLAALILTATFKDEFSWAGLVTIGALLALFFRGPHLIVSWWMVYCNQPLRVAYGEKEYRQIFIRNAGLVFLVSFVAFGSLALLPNDLGLFLLIFMTATSPITFHHTLSQDRGVISLLGGPDDRANHYGRYFRYYFLPLVFLFELVFLNAILYSRALGGGQGYIDLGSSYFIGFCLLMLSVSLAVITFSLLSGIGHVGRHLYLVFFSGTYGARALASLGVSGLGSALFESLRHNVVYLNIVAKYFHGRETSAEYTRIENLLIANRFLFWGLTLFMSLVFSFFSWQILVIMPNSLIESLGLSSSFWKEFSVAFIFVSFGVTGAVIYHHFYVERYLWRFRNPKLRNAILPTLLKE